MNICDLSNEDIIRIVTDIFSPKRIANITRHKREDYISCDIYMEWSSNDGGDKKEIKNEIELRDPFKYGLNAIRSAIIPVRGSGKGRCYIKLMQFCFAKGIKPDWMDNNPYEGNALHMDRVASMSATNLLTGEQVMYMPFNTCR